MGSVYQTSKGNKKISHIDRTGAWAYFGVTEGDPSLGGDGGILYTCETNYWKLKVGLGGRTKNRVELLALNLVLKLTVEKRIHKLQVITTMRNLQLTPFFLCNHQYKKFNQCSRSFACL